MTSDRPRTIAAFRRYSIIAAAVTAACTSTSLVNMWKDPDAPRQPVSHVLVVTLRKSSTTRRLWEDGFVRELHSHGIQATPSYQLFPDAAPDTTALIEAVRGRNFDGVLMTHQLSGGTETRYVPGYLAAEPVTYLSPWTGHYYTYYARIYSPGYVETDRVLRYETELYALREGGHVVWSGTTESINPASTSQVNKEIADVIVPALVRSGVARTP